MRVLGCLDGTNAEMIGHAVQRFFGAQTTAVGLLTVIDVGPRRDMDTTRERFMRHTTGHEPWIGEMQEAEAESARETLSEGAQHVANAEQLLRQGRPELEIVNAAAEWKADVILIGSRTEYGEAMHFGPRSIGHVARFVLEHAPCPVLVLRPFTREHFPISR